MYSRSAASNLDNLLSRVGRPLRLLFGEPGAFDGMSGIHPRIYPAQQGPYFLESRLLEMFGSGGSGFLVRTRAVHDNLQVAGIIPHDGIDVLRMRRNGARNEAILRANFLRPHVENDKFLAILDQLSQFGNGDAIHAKLTDK